MLLNSHETTNVVTTSGPA